MRQETKVIIEMVAKKRAEQISKITPGAESNLALDDSGLRGVLQVFEGGGLKWLEFIESVDTAGQIQFFDDYIEVARDLGNFAILFPVSKYSREFASAVYQSIMTEVHKKVQREVEFHGFVYDDLGNIKKVG